MTALAPPQGLSRDEYLRWFYLLEAALDQPNPSPALRRALRAIEEAT